MQLIRAKVRNGRIVVDEPTSLPEGHEVELSIMNRGFVDGDRLDERLTRLLADPDGRAGRIAEVRSRLDGFLRTAVPAVRERFHGKVTYAAIPFEGVDWDLFDIVTLELIRSAEVADRFRAGVRELVAQPKPVAVTGFASATWRMSCIPRSK